MGGAECSGGRRRIDLHFRITVPEILAVAVAHDAYKFSVSLCEGKQLQIQAAAAAGYACCGGRPGDAVQAGQYIERGRSDVSFVKRYLYTVNRQRVGQAELYPLAVAAGGPAGSEIVVEHIGRYVAIIGTGGYGYA